MPDLASFFAFDIALFVEAFVLLFAVVDSVGTVPIFIGLTEGVAGSRKRIVKHAIVISTAILVLFALFGWFIFDIFGININDFRVAGGIILFIVAVDHLRGDEDRSRGLQPSDIAAFPLATPLLAGPGAISTVIIISAPPYSPLLALLVVGCNAAVAYFVLSSSEWVRKYMGQNGTIALSRITALLIAALAVAFVAEGLKGLFPLL
ncbi:MAG: MarC family protein [Nitrososphaerota archaeon]|jgi:multiple antibiotic resistance protein|nr:MarC family protein [Nitrososphaerota archaeon]MDG6957473.1 MarC family protein [Nitrososphaerota archaeon]MDG6959714.1 MarC family protein [Nitrososphaerota archaeon]MDG6965038.1 MarC family protein [Nitrososphaerota archaeon]MDG6968086.1 MarC family protein [Nitrososphaerota archaeon]